MKISRLFHTLRYLKPIQFFYRLKNNCVCERGFKRIKYSEIQNMNLFIGGLHDEVSYLERFPFHEDEVEILNQTISLSFKDLEKYPPLIQFNIQYFEYAIVWAQKGMHFSTIKEKWNEYVKSNLKLHPYVVSLQIPNMIIAMSLYNNYDSEICNELYSRYRWLLKHQEKHLLANHYFENLKAIVISSFFFKETRVFNKYIKKLRKECSKQIHKDGMHFELSPMYHKIILEDLLLVHRVFKADWLNEYISLMLDAIVFLEDGVSRTPLFNDSGDNVAKTAGSLIEACKNELGIVPGFIDSLSQSGYYKIKDDTISLLVDSGPLGPNYNPGHAHCDCLSFEAFIDSRPLFVNSGTYQYQGDKRQYFRSTKAHNTAMICGHEQSDLWGEHRAGKRIKKCSGHVVNNCFSGSYLNQYNEECCREISLNNGILSVLDSFKRVSAGVSIQSFLHLAPGYSYSNGVITGFGNSYSVKTIGCSATAIDSLYSSSFGVLEKNTCLVFQWKIDKNKHGYIIKLNS